MKRKFLALALASGIVTTSFAQQNVGIGTTTPNASAALDVSSSNKGILIPRLDSAQRVAISNPAEGLMVYQKNGTKGFYYYNGTEWSRVGSSSSTGTPAPGGTPVFKTAVITPTSSATTTFDFSNDKDATVFIVDKSALNTQGTTRVKLPDASNYPTGTMIMLATIHGSGSTGSFAYNLWVPGCTSLHAHGYGVVNPGSDYVALGSGIYRRFITNGSTWYLVGL